ncbi:uncharacterized protein LOC135147810 [Daucus carota subsp. sativus]|uniref:uncharacterized protein LOC135147810 n=1 Tax=Daucus carota subsp. sativus TaxID=79200 RepID=UPI003083B0FC
MRITAIRESRDLTEISLEQLYGVLKTYELEQAQTKQRYGWGKTLNTSTSVINSNALVVESPLVKERKVVVPSRSSQEYVVPEMGHTSVSTGDDEFYSMEELDQLEDESLAMFARKFGNMRFRKNPSYRFKSSGNKFQKGGSSSTSKGAYKTGMVDRSKFKCFNCDEPDSDEEEERGNVALMAFMEPSKPPHRTGGFSVDPTCPKLFMQLGLERDDARNKIKALTLEHKALKQEVHELKLKEKLVLTPKIEQLTGDLLTQSNKVKVLEYRENKLNEQLAEEKVRCLAYKESTNIVKNLVDQQVIKRKVEDIENEREILASVEPMQVEGTFSSPKAGIGANGLKNNFNKPNKFVKCRNDNNTCSSTNNIRTSENVTVETVKPPVVLNNMPTVPLVDMCHKPCGVDNCMLCAFNVMSAFFKSMHANKENTTPRKHMNSKFAKTKTTGPSPIKKDTYVPKPKPKVFKAVCRKVSTVKVDANVIRTGSIVKADKGQFFKEPNKVEKVVWILDSGSSRHMTGDRALLSNVIESAGPIVTFGDNSKGRTTGYGNLLAENVIIEKFLWLKDSSTIFYDKGFQVNFVKEKYLISHTKDDRLALCGVRKANLYVADLNSGTTDEDNCFYSKASPEDSWL